jgi:4-amino-4-deoxy-L-arabinose transferase-like glycosyltransferase
MNLQYLTFSDAAKFADIARNLVVNLGYGGLFNFWSSSIFSLINSNIFPALSIPPIMPFSIAVFFKIFGISDFAVIATSFFYFVLTLIFVFLLAKELFKDYLVAALSTLTVGFNYDLIDYATKGASESPFIFEMVASAYFLTLKRQWATVFAFLFMVFMYFTRPQAFIYIAGLVLYYLLLRLKTKRAILCFLGVLGVGLFVDRFLLSSLAGRYFLYSITGRGLNATTTYIPGIAISNALRGSVSMVTPVVSVLKKVFYNLYNFYKLLPQIINPYLFTIFIIGVFRKAKGEISESFKYASVFIVVLTFLVTAASIPFFRYIHPVIPFVYIIAVGTLVEIINLQLSIYNKFSIFNFQFSKKTLLVFSSSFLVFIFAMGQTLGVIFLDSRFEANTHNVGKPPVYVKLSWILRDNTSKDQVIITNLDTWGSWYGERKTVWFPLEPKQIIDPVTGKIPFDAIYLTSYLIDDENYYMGADWRLIFNNPATPSRWACDGCAEIAKEFKLKGVYQIQASEDYEREDATSILLIKR